MIGSENVKALKEFYGKFLGKPVMEDGDWAGWQVGSCFLAVGSHSEAKGSAKEPFRVMFTFETKEVKEEFERIKAAGATVVKEPYQMEGDTTGAWIATLADPDGNYFQLMTPWEQPE